MLTMLLCKIFAKAENFYSWQLYMIAYSGIVKYCLQNNGAKACVNALGKILQERNALGFVLLSNCVWLLR